MAFFSNNPVIEFFHRLATKPSTVMMWLFTGLILSSTLYMLLLPVNYDGDDLLNEEERKRKGKDK
ncbi:hypothetical protein KAFR_0B00670 [Kazachstania africana CBS 2517]|uniref:Uncharacterized protein n=1 Tax=Kazachstania africana (strain ATCC 22294 / BCRC 22015 / CBS 2517 / CECT 1963 / NBRC 1671 / NRRL Y-8276) TaxID=1071382 RepID=H2APR6_KAZAF|nr:hypothetical protein KAFR_0B00670 [Kazachstania africana CBS 2517]CCF56366.1 hypothetical protein KAFR_0B00670 [Kazachstania africana CBS 2517]